MLQQHTASNTSRSPRKPQSIEAIAHPEAHLRLSTVLTLTGLGRSTWYALIAANQAPKGMKFGSRCARWRAGDITAFLAKRAQQGTAK